MSHSMKTPHQVQRALNLLNELAKPNEETNHRIEDFEPFSDGFGLMRDAQTAKPRGFLTGNGWFAYNLAVKLMAERPNSVFAPGSASFQIRLKC